MEPQRTLTDLPFEVLDMIFKALERSPYYLDDKLNLALASKYLGNAFVWHSRDVVVVAGEGSIEPKRTWPVILSLCGSKVVKYVGGPAHCYTEEVGRAVAQYCPNLQKLSFEVNIYNRDIFLSVIHNAKSAIRTLNFGYDFSDLEVAPDIMCEIPELPLLRKLRMAICYVNDAYQVERFLNIEELFLNPYTDLYPGPESESDTLNIFKAFAALKKLRVLAVADIHVISESDENEIIPQFSALETFELYSCQISMEFPSCPKLKVLDIDLCKSDIEGLVRKSVLKQGENLEKLTVFCEPSQYNNNDLLEVVRKFRKLRYLQINIQNISFDLKFVNELVKALRENGISGTDPLNLDLDKTTKVDELRYWFSQTSSSHLINISVYNRPYHERFSRL